MYTKSQRAEADEILTIGSILPVIALISCYLTSRVAAQYGTQFNFSQVTAFPGQKLQSLSWKAPRPLKFQHWYPAFGYYLATISNETCSLTLRAYEGSLSARVELPPVTTYCGAHLSCILSIAQEAAKANIAATTVLLGLTPSILAFLGPTIAEVSLLSLRRPILAILVSLGAPAICPTRIGTYDDPSAVYELGTGALVVPEIPRPFSILVSVAQYLLAACAASNVFQVSYDIGIRSVMSWACEFSYLPFFWTLLTGVIHLFAALALRISLSKPKDQGSSSTDAKSLRNWSIQFLYRECTLSANNSTSHQLENMRVGPMGIALNGFAGWFGIVHMAFGTAIFSGALFISTGDAATLILRYLASGTMCRLIIYFEVGGMRRVKEKSNQFKWIVQSRNLEIVDATQVTSVEEERGRK